MSEKLQSRLRRARRARGRIRKRGMHRLTVHRSARHIYAQLFSVDGSEVLASASTLEGELRAERDPAAVGALIASRALQRGVKQVAFDRSGFKYHGRVKALAEAARGGGLEF